MTDKHLVFYVKLHVKPECIDEWKRAVTDIVERMSCEPAFVSCDLHQDTPYRRDYEARLPALLERPREPTVLLPIGEWRK